MDYVPVVLSEASRCVERVSVHRVQDVGRRRISLQKRAWVGLTTQEFYDGVPPGGGGRGSTHRVDRAGGPAGPRHEVCLFGDPDIETVIPGGLHGDVATAAVVVNALPLAVDARPGLRVMTEVPPPRPRLGR